MQRDNEILRFNPDEQLDFGVDPTMPAKDAVELAVELNRKAHALADIATQRMSYAFGDRQVVHDAQRILLNVSHIGGFTTKIFKLCPDEHLALIANENSETK